LHFKSKSYLPYFQLIDEKFIIFDSIDFSNDNIIESLLSFSSIWVKENELGLSEVRDIYKARLTKQQFENSVPFIQNSIINKKIRELPFHVRMDLKESIFQIYN